MGTTTFFPKKTRNNNNNNNNNQNHSVINKKRQIILLDIDNTIYNDNILSIPIEKQIIQNTYNFCKDELNISSKVCDEFYLKYGTTVDGLRFLPYNNDENDNENNNNKKNDINDDITTTTI